MLDVKIPALSIKMSLDISKDVQKDNLYQSPI